MFSGCPSVNASVRPYLRASFRACRALVLLARYLAKRWTEFHQMLVNDIVQATNELIWFEGRRVKVRSLQGQM